MRSARAAGESPAETGYHLGKCAAAKGAASRKLAENQPAEARQEGHAAHYSGTVPLCLGASPRLILSIAVSWFLRVAGCSESPTHGRLNLRAVREECTQQCPAHRLQHNTSLTRKTS